ncbi:MAG: MarR family transcriptional regulator [Acidobacteria bacterium]|nr:MarR family transcriptional regulator [Acidobacteriota bacterium]MBI3426352.1 MarR family transcriptional regulator [Acidobacteriota bacterium]
MGFRTGLGMGLRGAYFSMHRSFQAFYARHGATADQFVVLSMLAEEDGITQQELARRVFSDPNTITAMLTLLEKRGLAKREDHEADGRAWLVYLTPKGRQFQRTLHESAEHLHTRLREAVPPEQLEMVLNVLRKIAEAMPSPERKSRKAQPQKARKLSKRIAGAKAAQKNKKATRNHS